MPIQTTPDTLFARLQHWAQEMPNAPIVAAIAVVPDHLNYSFRQPESGQTVWATQYAVDSLIAQRRIRTTPDGPNGSWRIHLQQVADAASDTQRSRAVSPPDHLGV